MNWEKLPAIDKDGLHIGCLNCSSAALVAPMGMIIGVGFGSAYVTKGDECIYDEQQAEHEGIPEWTVQDAENAALADPDHDWRIVKHGPMHGEAFQRHGPGQWVCVESNEGFA